MDSKEFIVEVYLEIANNISKIDDILDKVFDPINDYMDTLGDLATPIKTMHKVVNYGKRLKVKNFAKEYAKKINNGQQLNYEQVEKLEKYMSKESNREFMAQIIDSAINSKSNKCSAILGYYSGKILADLITINYEDMTIVNALREMNDLDLTYFKYLYPIFNQVITELNKEIRFFSIRIEDYEKLPNYIGTIFNKFKSLQIISEDIAGGLRLRDDKPSISGCLTDISDYLYRIIIESKVQIDI